MESNWFDLHTASITLINYGITCGWSSPSIDLLTSDKSPLPSGKITMEEASWIASALAIGALPGNVVFGFLIKKFGRKWPLTASSILTIVKPKHCKSHKSHKKYHVPKIITDQLVTYSICTKCLLFVRCESITRYCDWWNSVSFSCLLDWNSWWPVRFDLAYFMSEMKTNES